MLRPIEMEVNGVKVPLVIEVKRVYGVKPGGYFRCYFDMVLRPWGIHIYGCKLFQGTAGQLWARFPQRTYKHHGESKWGDVVSIDDSKLRDEIALCARESLQGS